MSRSMSVGLVSGLVMLCLTSRVEAGLVIGTAGVAVTVDYTGFEGDGFAPAPTATQLDSDDWRADGGVAGNAGTFGGTHTTGDFARGASSGGVGTGGVYGFDVSNGGTVNRALGFQPAGSDFTPGTITLMLTNNTGQELVSLDISYDALARNDQDRSNALNFAHSANDAGYISIGALNFASPGTEDLTPTWQSSARATSITGLSLANGANYFLQWQLDDISGAGSRDEFAIDNISITGNAASAVPEPSSLMLLSLGGFGIAFVRRRA